MADETQPDVQAQPAAAPVVDQTTSQSAPEAVSAAPEATPDPSPAEAATEQSAPSAAPAPAAPVVVDNLNKRDDTDASVGQFAKVTDGEHAGQIGVYAETLEHDPETGYPSLVLLHFRDAAYEHAQAKVPYDSIVPVPNYNGGR